MNCFTAKQLISLFLDNELTGSKELKLREHLASCSSCRAELHAQMQTNELLGILPDIESSFTLADIKSQVTQQRNTFLGRIAGFAWIPPMPRWTSTIAVTVSILLGTLGGFSIHTTLQPAKPHTDISARGSADVVFLAGFDDPVANALNKLPEVDN